MADRPTIYLKHGCPFCLKLRIFLTEAGIANRFNLVTFEDGDDMHRKLRQRTEDAGQQPSFPAAELEPGTLTTGTDDLIAHFAAEARVDPASLPLLQDYSTGVFERHVAMHKELAKLKAA